MASVDVFQLQAEAALTWPSQSNLELGVCTILGLSDPLAGPPASVLEFQSAPPLLGADLRDRDADSALRRFSPRSDQNRETLFRSIAEHHAGERDDIEAGARHAAQRHMEAMDDARASFDVAV